MFTESERIIKSISFQEIVMIDSEKIYEHITFQTDLVFMVSFVRLTFNFE